MSDDIVVPIPERSRRRLRELLDESLLLRRLFEEHARALMLVLEMPEGWLLSPDLAAFVPSQPRTEPAQKERPHQGAQA